MTTMTLVPPPSPRPRMYGFNIYKDGQFIREQMVPAGSAAIAEVKVWRYLGDGEYPWYAVPRLDDPDEGDDPQSPTRPASLDAAEHDEEEDAA